VDGGSLPAQLKLPRVFTGILRIREAPRLRTLRIPSLRLEGLHLEACGIRRLPNGLSCGDTILRDLPFLESLPRALQVRGTCLLDDLPLLNHWDARVRIQGTLLVGLLGPRLHLPLELWSETSVGVDGYLHPRLPDLVGTVGMLRTGSLNPRLIQALLRCLRPEGVLNVDRPFPDRPLGRNSRNPWPWDAPSASEAPRPRLFLEGARLRFALKAGEPPLNVPLLAAFQTAHALGKLGHLLQLLLDTHSPLDEVFRSLDQLNLKPRERAELGAFLAIQWSLQLDKLRMLEELWIRRHGLSLPVFDRELERAVLGF
jgi:hypothetical protein